MPALKNQKQEAFAQAVALGMSAVQASATTQHPKTMPAKKSPSKRKRPAKQKTGGGCPGATCSEFAGIQALIQIREGLGDPCGKLMQDELVDKVLNLIQGEKELREGVIQYIKRREDDGEDECVDELKYLLDYTQWWDWDFTPPNDKAHL